MLLCDFPRTIWCLLKMKLFWGTISSTSLPLCRKPSSGSSVSETPQKHMYVSTQCSMQDTCFFRVTFWFSEEAFQSWKKSSRCCPAIPSCKIVPKNLLKTLSTACFLLWLDPLPKAAQGLRSAVLQWTEPMCNYHLCPSERMLSCQLQLRSCFFKAVFSHTKFNFQDQIM